MLYSCLTSPGWDIITQLRGLRLMGVFHLPGAGVFLLSHNSRMGHNHITKGFAADRCVSPARSWCLPPVSCLHGQAAPPVSPAPWELILRPAAPAPRSRTAHTVNPTGRFLLDCSSFSCFCRGPVPLPAPGWGSTASPLPAKAAASSAPSRTSPSPERADQGRGVLTLILFPVELFAGTMLSLLSSFRESEL